MFIDKSNTFLKMNHSSVMFPVHCQAPSAVQVGVTIKFLNLSVIFTNLLRLPDY